MTLEDLYVFYPKGMRGVVGLETRLRGLGYVVARASRPPRAHGGNEGGKGRAFLVESVRVSDTTLERLTLDNPSAAAFWCAGASDKTPEAFGVGQMIRASESAESLRTKIRFQGELAALRRRLQKERGYRAEEARYREILNDVMRTVNSSLEIDVVLEVVMNKIQSLIQAEGWSIILKTAEKELAFKLALGPKGESLKDVPLKWGQGLAGWVVEHSEPLMINDAHGDPRFDKSFDKKTNFTTRSVLCVPLVSRGKTIGAVEIINKKDPLGFTSSDLALLSTLVEPAAVAIENAMLFEEIRRLTVTDDLTKLYNIRYFNEVLNRELSRAKRHGHCVSVIFLDLDNFKTVNDRFGHLAGSRTLYEVGRILADLARGSDVVCRYGGDEFILILSETDVTGGRAIAERIREAIAKATLLGEMNIAVNITASVGVACFPDHAKSREEIIHAADAAMYHIKLNGKNGVAMAPEGQQPAASS